MRNSKRYEPGDLNAILIGVEVRGMYRPLRKSTDFRKDEWTSRIDEYQNRWKVCDS